VTLALVLAPFLHSGEALGQIFTRVFPLQRGLYEDKVANVWCALGPVLKLRERFTQDQLLRFSALSTLLACLPSVLSLLCRPDRRRFIYALASSSLAFFLFSYQVHEKSILLPLLPVSMLLLDEPTLVPWFVNAATFSMYPLLKRDGVLIPLFAGWALWNWLGGFLPGSVRGSPLFQIVIWVCRASALRISSLDSPRLSSSPISA
jgi:alpha-1,3-glucosyltransferase